MLDHYIWGDVHRISPEAPVPVISARRETWTAGGAANVALNLAALGVQTIVMGRIGQDDAGLRLKDLLKVRNVEFVGDETHCDQVGTIVKTRVLARNQQVCRIDHESNYADYRIDHLPVTMAHLTRLLPQLDAVIISDYAKGVVNQSLMDSILAQRGRTFVALDPKPARTLRFTGLNLLTPNRVEAMQLAGISEPTSGEPYPLEDICRLIHEKLAPENLIITLGADGMAVCQDGIVKAVLPTLAQEVFDVSGAGDTVIATLTAAFAVGTDSVLASRLANAAAGCVVAHVGTVPVVLRELLAMLQRNADPEVCQRAISPIIP